MPKSLPTWENVLPLPSFTLDHRNIGILLYQQVPHFVVDEDMTIHECQSPCPTRRRKASRKVFRSS